MARSSTTFQPGKSGNPLGKPKAHLDVRIAIAAALPSVVQMLVDVVENVGEDIDRRMAAGKTLLDYGLAKPRDTTPATTGADALAKLADALAEPE